MALTTVSNVALYLQQTIDGSSTPLDTTVSEWIDEVSDEIEHITKQKFEVNTVTNLIMATNSDTTRTSANAMDQKGDYDPIPRDEIILPHENIIGLTKFEINTVADGVTPVWTELTVGYGADVILNGNRVSFLTTNFDVLAQKTGVRVTYTHGESSVPKFVQKIATRMTALNYLSSGTSSDVSGGGGDIRVGDIEISEPGKFTQDFINQEEKWIELKLNELGTHTVRLI